MEEILHFKVSTGLKDIIGRELITNELVAIFELVKNSYDADAKNIEILIDNFNNFIEIKDDGHGMGYDDLKNKWLFVAYSEKKEQTNTTYAGSKGIGRFSCDRLGSQLILRSKTNDQDSELIINWGKFEENTLKKFEELDIKYSSGENISNLSVDTISKCGTTLRISNLRDNWSVERAKKVISALQRLVNPFVKDNDININVKYTDSSSGIMELNERVYNNVSNVLDTKTIYMECRIKGNSINLSLVDKKKVIYDLVLENYSMIDNAFFKIYYLNSSAKNNFKRIMKQRAIEYGSIFLYKNNFRIFPYGEPDFDSFGLNLRKGQGYNRYLAHRELLGWINIIDKEDHFKEVSSRDRGFIANDYTISLEKIYMELIQRPLESYVQLVKFGDSEIDDISDSDGESIDKLLRRFKKFNILNEKRYEIPKNAQPIEKRFDLLDYENITTTEKKEIQKDLKKVMTATRKENVAVKKEKKKIEKKVHQLQNQVEITERILEKENPEKQKVLFHELGKVSKELNDVVDIVVDMMTTAEIEKFNEYLVSVRKSADKLDSIKKQILRLNFETFSKLANIELKSYLLSYLKYAASKKIKLNTNFGDGRVVKEINIYDFGVLIDNLILNAAERDATTIDVSFKQDNTGFTFTSDTGPIDIKPVENIFKLGVSSKDDGSGMGLYLCSEICKEFGWLLSVDELLGNLVRFNIDFGEYNERENQHFVARG